MLKRELDANLNVNIIVATCPSKVNSFAKKLNSRETETYEICIKIYSKT